METEPFSPKKQYRVLDAINRIVNARRDNDSTIQLDFPDISPLDLSWYLRLLTDLGFIKSFDVQDPSGTYTYATGITSKGLELLNASNKSFWEKAEDIAIQTFKDVTKVDVSLFVDFFRSAYSKYQEGEL